MSRAYSVGPIGHCERPPRLTGRGNEWVRSNNGRIIEDKAVRERVRIREHRRDHDCHERPLLKALVSGSVCGAMRPRTEVAALDIDSTEEDVWAVVRRERYSRYPVYRDTLDDVLGVFLAKDLWLHDGPQPFALKDFVRTALYVPSSKPAERVMDDLRKTRAQMAVVLDEYGGTAGILTMEDLVEEVVGDIADEYDFASRTAVIMDGVLELAGSMSLVDVRSDYGLRIPEGDWTTLGGYAFGRLGRLPKIGDRVSFPGGELEIIALEGRRVAGLRVHRDNADKVAASTPARAAAH